jgi:hypothetical protein
MAYTCHVHLVQHHLIADLLVPHRDGAFRDRITHCRHLHQHAAPTCHGCADWSSSLTSRIRVRRNCFCFCCCCCCCWCWCACVRACVSVGRQSRPLHGCARLASMRAHTGMTAGSPPDTAMNRLGMVGKRAGARARCCGIAARDTNGRLRTCCSAAPASACLPCSVRRQHVVTQKSFSASLQRSLATARSLARAGAEGRNSKCAWKRAGATPCGPRRSALQRGRSA